MWGYVVIINTIVCTLCCGFLIYSVGLSLYLLNPRPFVLGIFLVVLTISTEIIFGILAD